MGRKVAILGGGPAAMAAALELTNPDLPTEQRCDVTVYTMGWRLGGKCASGRNAVTGQRIEEHGLHIWFGFYDNGFEVMRRVYDEAARETGPLRTFDDAFRPCNTVVLFREDAGGGWTPKSWTFPERKDEAPGMGDDPSRVTVLRRMLDWLLAGRPAGSHGEVPSALDDHLGALEDLLDRLDTQGDDGMSNLLNLATSVLEGFGVDLDAGAEGLLGVAAEILDDARDAIWPVGALPGVGDVVEYAMALDLAAATLRGIRADNVIEEGFGAIDHHEFSDWLLMHGARAETVATSPLLRAFYQLIFGFRAGDRGQRCVAAGKAAQALIRIIATYKGAILWKMQAGMGDAIFAPIYEVLDRRGVRFEFFHRVERLELDPAAEAVERVRLVKQAEVRDGRYDPLVVMHDGLACWPSRPRYEQLVDPDLERNYEGDHGRPGVSEVVLQRGSDFDDVVLAIPIGGLADVCADLLEAREDWRRAFDTAETVATQALQLWLSDAGRLQWRWDSRSTVAGAYREPLDTYCDMSHLVTLEDWPTAADGTMHCAYFCGVMRDGDADATAAAAQERAKEDGLVQVRDRLAPVWPGAYDADGRFDWALLHDPEDREGEARFEAQYWRANTELGERYVLTPPGSVEHRLRPGETGFENLVVAGDWTRNGICGGSVEAAITSGRLAAQALTGHPAAIAGVAGWLCDDRTPTEKQAHG